MISVLTNVQTTLAARVIAFIMAARSFPQQEVLAGALERIGLMYRSSGKKTNIRESDRLRRWARECRDGKVPNTKCVRGLAAAMEEIKSVGFVGSPTVDWSTVRRALETSDADQLKRTGEQARYLRLLRRGSAIEDKLSDLWRKQGQYLGAEGALHEAITRDQIIDDHREISRISVMTMHQLKGREYDAVLLVEDRHHGFRGREDNPPFMENTAATPSLVDTSLSLCLHSDGVAQSLLR